MSVLSDFFVATPDTAKLYVGHEPFPTAHYCQYKSLTPLQAAQILAVLRGTPYHVSLIGEFPLVDEKTEDGPWTVKVPDDMVTRLAELQDVEVQTQSVAWAVETKEELAWTPVEFEPIVRDLVRLARAARADGKSMYLWNCL
jgi:hypothetical protein